MPSRAALGDRQSWPIRHRPKNDLGLGQSHVILKGIQNGGSGSGCGPTFLLAQRQISVLQHSISPHCCQQGTMVLQVGCSKCLPCGGSSCTARAQGMQIPNAGHRQVGLQSIHRIGTQENILCRTCPRRPADRAAVQRSSRRHHMQQVRPACVCHTDGALLQAHLLQCSLQRTLLRHRFLCRAMAAPTSAFDIPAAPILIPKGPWKEVNGCVCAPKGFKAQGEQSSGGRPARHVQGDWFPPTTRCLSSEGP